MSLQQQPIQLKGGYETFDPRLDRLPQWDPRNERYGIMEALRPEQKLPRSYTWRCSLNLDQGREGACVGFSVSHEGGGRPVIVPGITDATAQSLYKRAQQLDEWPGEQYSGTSVIAGIKAAVEKGWYLEYRWALDVDDLILAVGYKGPAVLGIDWWTGMYDTDEKGFVHANGTVAGGHAILCNGFSVPRQAFKLHNSWGAGWGVNGECWLSVEDARKLLASGGEACIPSIRKKGATA